MPKRALPAGFEDSQVYQVDGIVGVKVVHGEPLYRVKWTGFDGHSNSWLRDEDFVTPAARMEVEEFKRNNAELIGKLLQEPETPKKRERKLFWDVTEEVQKPELPEEFKESKEVRRLIDSDLVSSKEALLAELGLGVRCTRSAFKDLPGSGEKEENEHITKSSAAVTPREPKRRASADVVIRDDLKKKKQRKRSTISKGQTVPNRRWSSGSNKDEKHIKLRKDSMTTDDDEDENLPLIQYRRQSHVVVVRNDDMYDEDPDSQSRARPPQVYIFNTGKKSKPQPEFIDDIPAYCKDDFPGLFPTKHDSEWKEKHENRKDHNQNNHHGNQENVASDTQKSNPDIARIDSVRKIGKDLFYRVFYEDGGCKWRPEHSFQEQEKDLLEEFKEAKQKHIAQLLDAAANETTLQ